MKNSINELVIKIKATVGNKKLMLEMAIVVLLAIGSFGLGRLSAVTGGENTIKILQLPHNNTNTASLLASTPAMKLGGQVVASKNGKTYYYPWCGSAKNIKLGNKIYFESEPAALKAGLIKAKNCK